jgi:hypothetical protein
LTIPAVGTATADVASLAYGNGDFSISFSKQPPSSIVDAHIKISGKDPQNSKVWKATATARQALMSQFTDFLTQIETRLELAAKPVVFPGATAVIGHQIAEVIPAPLAETLFYHFGMKAGLDPGTSPYIDIRPGMRLRIEPEASQFISPGSLLNGYVGNGQCYYQVSSVPDPANRLAHKLTFDPFLGAISSPQIAPTTGTNINVISGAIDLQRAGYCRRHWRLFYPQSLPAGDTAGDVGPAKNVTLIGADTLADLGAATAAYTTTGTQVGGTAVYAIFRGRTIVVPEIPILVDSGSGAVKEFVPVGTSLMNILQQNTAWRPRANLQRVIKLRRLQTNLRSDPFGSSLRYTSVDLANPLYELPLIDSRAFDIPLVQSDKVIFSADVA